MKTLIRIVGPIASGKGVVVDMFKEKGFVAFSLSDRIRAELKTRGMLENRKNLQDVGDALRKEFGNDVLVQRTRSLLEGKTHEQVVIESIRNPAEIRLLKEMGAIIIGVSASSERRYQYLQKRQRSGDVVTFEKFTKVDKREFERGSEGHKIQINECLKMADMIIDNEGSIDNLREGVENGLKRLGIGSDFETRERLG